MRKLLAASHLPLKASAKQQATRESPMTPLPAAKALEAYFLEARCKILEVAAILDRIGRGRDPSATDTDPRVARIREALEVLADHSGGRAERIQKIFSLDYDVNWERPKPR
jgi:hypothetical protein